MAHDTAGLTKLADDALAQLKSNFQEIEQTQLQRVKRVSGALKGHKEGKSRAELLDDGLGLDLDDLNEKDHDGHGHKDHNGQKDQHGGARAKEYAIKEKFIADSCEQLLLTETQREQLLSLRGDFLSKTLKSSKSKGKERYLTPGEKEYLKKCELGDIASSKGAAGGNAGCALPGGASVSNVVDKELSPEAQQLIVWLKESKVNDETMLVLLANGVDSIEALAALEKSDVDLLGLPLGQTRLVQKVLQTINVNQTYVLPSVVQDVGIDKAVPEAVHTDAAGLVKAEGARHVSRARPMVGASDDGVGELDTEMFLGMGICGKNKPFYNITDFVRRKVTHDGNMNLDMKEHEDGSVTLNPCGARKVALKDVTWFQWSEANTQIMAKVVAEGASYRNYMAYTCHISQLAQKYQWWSVLEYDRQYRQAQANIGFPWGYDFPAFRDATLVVKERPKGPFQKWNSQGRKVDRNFGSGNTNTGATGTGQGQRRPAWGQKGGQFKDRFQAEICRDFNFRKCTRERCIYMHVCAKCHASDHGELGHPK